MRRRQFLTTAMGAPLWAQPPQRKRPNVILILADDLGYSDLGFQGATDIPTPNLDALARTGVRFTNAYVSHPFCSPTRAGLMTGRYQQRFGHENNPVYDPKDEVAGLPVTEKALPHLFQQAGYVTGHVGKWHLGAAPKFHPLERGFTESFGFLGGGHDYFEQQLEGNPREYLIPLHRSRTSVAEREYLTDALSREAAAFVTRHRERPFFLYLAYNTPHTPQQVTDAYLQRFRNIADERRRKYAAMVSSMDDGIGRVMEAVKQSGLDDNTIFFFLSDNGGPVGVNGSTNTPLRSAKGSVYEGGIRVPLVARWQGRWKPDVSDVPVISLDVLPTALDSAGLALPSNLDGRSFRKQVQNGDRKPAHQRLFWRTGGGAAWAVREGRYKLAKPAGEAVPQLFDLATDMGEQTDRSAAEPRITANLQQAFETWNRQLIRPIFESPRPAGKKKG
ncbi:MAG: sulfatase [Bryobacterales bacterium]|nr:sulfatase [Bryobacterales bacterium]